MHLRKRSLLRPFPECYVPQNEIHLFLATLIDSMEQRVYT
jgi:hypothetical protein